MSPRSAKQFEAIRLESRKKILDAAMELFATRGFHNTSIEQIRKKAGVSKGLIYNYFSSKEDLMNQLVFDQLEMGKDLLEKLGKMNSPEERFAHILDVSFEYITAHQHHSKLMVAISLQLDDFPKLKSIIMSKYTGTMPLFAQLMQDLGVENPEQEAKAISAMLDGIGIQHIVVGEEAIDLHEMKQFLLNKYIPTT